MKKLVTTVKINLHPRNIHRNRYDFETLVLQNPELKNYLFLNEHQIESIDFSDATAVKALNRALLHTYYHIQNWDIPSDYLCPPIPGRADYIHYVADLLASCNHGIIPEGENIMGLDIGLGANAIYPILGNSIYNWNFVGTDIDENALQNCQKIIASNAQLTDAISLQLQLNPRFIFKNIITAEDRFAFSICNPPFHSSAETAAQSNLRKINNLSKNNAKSVNPALNFGGQNTELWCEGGELAFVKQMIFESAKYPLQCLWFTTLVSKESNLNTIYKTINRVGGRFTTIQMAQGQKTSRMVAWTFLTEAQQKTWKF